MQPADPRVADLVQSGKIRLGLFLPQYVNDPASGALRGIGTGVIAIEIALALAARLDIEASLIALPTPTKAVEALKHGGCDVAFLGIEPTRAAEVDFTSAVFEFDYTYLVPANSTIRGCADAERPGVRVAIVSSHASALALRRGASQAELIGSELPDAALALLVAGKADAFALPREQLLDYSAKLPGSRVLDDSYGINRVAIAVQKGRLGWRAFFSEFIEEAKASGLIARIIACGALRGFQVAAPATAN
jgi:polar amino acid transport system substrate-binding protein